MIIVTGGAGAIGSALVWKLNRLGITRILVVDDLGSSAKWKNLAQLRFADYLHKAVFLEQIRQGSFPFRPRAIVHLGACSATTETNVDYLMENNYRYTRILAEWALARDVRFIYASSAATYGDGALGYADSLETARRLAPLNAYGFSKQLVDQWAIDTGAIQRIAGLKFFNVYGPNEYHKGSMTSAVYNAFHQIRASGKMRLFRSHRPDFADGQQQRDFVYAKDCVEILAWLIDQPQVNGLFNVGTGVARTWNDLAAAVFAAMGRPTDIEYIEMPAGLRNQYQYFTQAEMHSLRQAGCPVACRSLESGVRDYVVNFLATANPYLDGKSCTAAGEAEQGDAVDPAAQAA